MRKAHTDTLGNTWVLGCDTGERALRAGDVNSVQDVAMQCSCACVYVCAEEEHMCFHIELMHPGNSLFFFFLVSKCATCACQSKCIFGKLLPIKHTPKIYYFLVILYFVAVSPSSTAVSRSSSTSFMHCIVGE